MCVISHMNSGVEKVVPEILGRGGAVSDVIRSLHTASCITEWSRRNGRGRSEGGGRGDRSHFETWMSRRLPQTSARFCLFSRFFSLFPPSSISLSLLARLFDSCRLHLSFSRTMAVIPLSPVTQKPPEGDGNDVPPIRIMTNQTIERERERKRETLGSRLSLSTCTAISSRTS